MKVVSEMTGAKRGGGERGRRTYTRKKELLTFGVGFLIKMQVRCLPSSRRNPTQRRGSLIRHKESNERLVLSSIPKRRLLGRAMVDSSERRQMRV